MQPEQPKSFVYCGLCYQWHVPIGLEAVKNGKHVRANGNGHDKSLADSSESARELVEAAEAAGVVNAHLP